MLSASDLKKRLQLAMAERPEVKQARIAEATGKTPQAVSAWVRTGQIDPVHFPVLARLFGKPLEYWHGTDAEGVTVREPASVYQLPSQSAGRPDPIVRASRATAEKLAARLGIDRSSDEFLDILDAIRDSMQQAFEEATPDNRVDLAVKLSPQSTEETRNADGREDRGNGDDAGQADRGAARKPVGARGGKRK